MSFPLKTTSFCHFLVVSLFSSAKMERWANKVALVTGAGSGIGAQMCEDLCEKNLTVVGIDLKKSRLDHVYQKINYYNPSARFSFLVCDVTKEEEIQSVFDKVIEEHGGVDILINCAGIMSSYSLLEDGGDEVYERVFQTNVLAVISCIKKAVQSMTERDVPGHVVNMCSVAGHCVATAPGLKPVFSAYYASKHAIRALNQLINQELVFYGHSKIRISNISPALVGGTEIVKGTGVDNLMENAPQLTPKDISDVLMFILGAPEKVQIREVIVESVGSAMY